MRLRSPELEGSQQHHVSIPIWHGGILNYIEVNLIETQSFDFYLRMQVNLYPNGAIVLVSVSFDDFLLKFRAIFPTPNNFMAQ